MHTAIATSFSLRRLATAALIGASGLVTFLASPVRGQDTDERSRPVEGEDFRVYDIAGRSSSFAAVLKELSDTDVVLVGEEHDDVIGHRFEAELLAAAYRRLHAEDGREVILSLEMFERDVQYILAEYLDGAISETHFLNSSRPWESYEDHYRPLVEFSKQHGLAVVAANAPRRYVNRVSREGPESLSALSATAKSFLPPLPYPGPSTEYRAQWDALMAEAMAEAAMQSDSSAADVGDDGAGGDEAPVSQHYAINPNVIYSQALWDASMGHAVTSALQAAPGALVLHMAGSFHVQRGTGIPERIADYAPAIRILSIVMVSVDDITAWDDEEHEGLGDFVVLTRLPEAVADGSGN
jgi:uncharacterized iron-regulated protein